MNQQQSIAILHPCERAEQCANRRYRRFEYVRDLVISIVLTVNVGEE